MTDKQIIIDGIDVSGCSCIENGYCLWVKKYYETGLTPKCEQVKDCYYKQLKRKEQECEELAYENYELNELFDRLKAENEKLDTENKRLVAELANPVFDSFEELDKLKATLTEIKEIAEHCIKQDICTTCDNSDKCHIEDEEIPTYDVCKLILQKISECEVK